PSSRSTLTVPHPFSDDVERKLYDRHGLVARHCGKVFQKFVERNAIGQVVRKGIDWNSSAFKNRSSAHDVWIDVNRQLLNSVFFNDEIHFRSPDVILTCCWQAASKPSVVSIKEYNSS